MIDPIVSIRAAPACKKCLEIHGRKNPGGVDIEKTHPMHLRAITWAYLCDDCCRIVLAALSEAYDRGKEDMEKGRI